MFKVFTEELAKELLKVLAEQKNIEVITETKASKDTGTFKVVISTAGRDRQGDVVDQNGWELERYKKNPVVLWAHSYYELPIGVTDKIYVENNELVAEGRFASHEFAQKVRSLYDAGMLPATSVGFIAKEMQGSVITRAELLEFSFVPVPANPEVRDLAKTLNLNIEEMIVKGIFTKDEQGGEEEAPTQASGDEGEQGEAKAEDKEEEVVETPEPEAAGEQPEKTAEEKPADEEPKETEEQIEKAGRTLSAKNREQIKIALDGMKAATAALEALLEATMGDGEDKSQDQNSEDQKGSIESVGQKSGQEIVDLLKVSNDSTKVLKAIATLTSEALQNINRKHAK